MKFSKKTRYALRALVDLSYLSKSEHVALNFLAENNSIPFQYLEHAFASLRRGGIVKSIKGSQGGYFLSKPASEITIGEILEALEGGYRVDDEEIIEESNYRYISDAIQETVIGPINEALEKLLNHITLADIEEEYVSHLHKEQDMYYI